MKLPLRYTNLPLKSMTVSFINLPSPKLITYMWNMGSLLGLILVMQIVTGLFLSFYYISETNLAFLSVVSIMREVNIGWLIRFIHANGASLFFLICYLHMSRGLFHSSYRFTHTWLSGSIIYLLLMGTGFLGYVLPWGQMSLWGAMVITNLISVIPIYGISIIQWIWGAFSMGTSTLNCFYSLHYILPFIIVVMIMMHMIFLHLTGSSSSIGVLNDVLKIKFDLLFTIKDSMNVIVFILFILMNLMFPFMMMESENFIPANPMSSPLHIVPEWYFLYVYAILRSIPNKVGGVLALCGALLCIFLISLVNKDWKSSHYLSKLGFWLFISVFLLLTWLGGQPVENPYILFGQVLTLLYFIMFIVEFTSSFVIQNLIK